MRSRRDAHREYYILCGLCFGCLSKFRIYFSGYFYAFSLLLQIPPAGELVKMSENYKKDMDRHFLSA
nr:MAG TPA: hypothetical protein [Caudoviricetes sp.]